VRARGLGRAGRDIIPDHLGSQREEVRAIIYAEMYGCAKILWAIGTSTGTLADVMVLRLLPWSTLGE